ncbi:TRAP transporter small permease [Desulfoscipio geothermicus]|uniref:TRAP-type mannitol/chloroaromatic compound transport system, small permease component n=1 Tax=Desulfoscipio geothermicus DSM 3669 TaxID=1121426 RepID=A0A1I6DSD5_9FIRM|nr:TRAP transporter small permease [Desulfoscipio geothermicus]SFR08390.1 TRAP-type mannitol/chloroaromatic compound transport system, small permease component [Desulfoscipio geothermicus DSM 3669]
MKKFSGLVAGLSRLLDRIAALCIVSVMVLVVANILLRALLGRPILGTYEYVGFLTAAMIGLALASCALQNGHIAVSFVMEKLPARIQACVDIIINVFALCFWGLAAWYTGKYANGMTVSGVVSPTTQTPFYPFVYLVSFGLLALCLVLLAGLVESIKRAAINK